jgi:hypothetical protein
MSLEASNPSGNEQIGYQYNTGTPPSGNIAPGASPGMYATVVVPNVGVKTNIQTKM